VTALSDLRAGDTILLGCTIVQRSAAGFLCTLYSTERDVLGTLTMGVDLVMAGTIAAAPNTVPVTVLGRAFQAGDVVVSAGSGETFVVRDSWVTKEGWRWSSSPQRTSTYSTDGWSVVGSATIN
jgi:hypothetical protein